MSVRASVHREADGFIDARSLSACISERRIYSDRVLRAAAVVDGSEICAQINEWRKSDATGRGAGGRPSAVPDRAILTVLLLLAVDGAPLHVSAAADVIENRLDTDGRDALGIRQHLADGERWYDRTWRALHRLLDVIDPYPAPRRTISDDDFARVLEARKAEAVDRKVERLDWFANQLIDMTWLTLPRNVRRRWNGNICIDAT